MAFFYSKELFSFVAYITALRLHEENQLYTNAYAVPK